jgi:hypothetical protein
VVEGNPEKKLSPVLNIAVPFAKKREAGGVWPPPTMCAGSYPTLPDFLPPMVDIEITVSPKNLNVTLYGGLIILIPRRTSPMSTPPSSTTMQHVFVDGIVAQRDKEPYVRLTVGSGGAQLTIAEAHKIAFDIIVMAARTEADAMILRFFSKADFPDGAAAALMLDFRTFRLEQDRKVVEGQTVDPDSGEIKT